MRTRKTFWILLTVILCLASFWFGRNLPRPVYDQNPLAIDRALLTTLRAGNTTNAIGHLEALLDLETLAAMHNRTSLHGLDRKILDRTLGRVAQYRQQYPRTIDTSTNDMPPQDLPQAMTWISEQQQIDVFLRNFLTVNEPLKQ
jgi:hypothetical protein